MKILSRILVPFLIAFILDGISKYWAEAFLEPHQPVPVVGEWFRLTLGYNTGVAFGMLSNGGSLPLYLTGAIIIIITVWFTRGLFAGHFAPVAAWPVGLLLGGAIGNFVDRSFDGRVTDFLDVGIAATRWPTFNLADTFILTGVGILMVLSFQEDHPPTDEKPSSAAPQPEKLESQHYSDTI